MKLFTMQRLMMGAVMMVMLLAGCRPTPSPTATPDATVQITLESPSTPYKVGDKSTVVIVVKDGSGNPINGAKVEVRGDMNMAGMLPVTASTTQSTNDGRYTLTLNWNMGGEWFIDVTVTLADGRTANKRFDKIQVGS